MRLRTGSGGYRLEMTGHAGYCPGNDIVCAGASALAFALAGFLHDCGGHVAVLVEERLEPGDLCIHCLGDAMVAQAYRLVLTGLCQLEARYPNYVQVRWEPEPCGGPGEGAEQKDRGTEREEYGELDARAGFDPI